jgi:hypothetical protein
MILPAIAGDEETAMAVQVSTGLALKEWAAVIDAMEQGRQIVALRKGGIREKAFLVEGRTFYLLPTFEHQGAELLKPAYRRNLDRALVEQRSDDGLVVRTRADVVDVWEIDDLTRVAALSPYHIFSDDYASSRFQWRPKQALTVLLLRVASLAKPWHTGLPSGAGGCRSWFELDTSAAPEIGAEAIAEPDFARQAAELTALLGPAATV